MYRAFSWALSIRMTASDSVSPLASVTSRDRELAKKPSRPERMAVCRVGPYGPTTSGLYHCT